MDLSQRSTRVNMWRLWTILEQVFYHYIKQRENTVLQRCWMDWLLKQNSGAERKEEVTVNQSQSIINSRNLLGKLALYLLWGNQVNTGHFIRSAIQKIVAGDSRMFVEQVWSPWQPYWSRQKPLWPYRAKSGPPKPDYNGSQFWGCWWRENHDGIILVCWNSQRNFLSGVVNRTEEATVRRYYGYAGLVAKDEISVALETMTIAVDIVDWSANGYRPVADAWTWAPSWQSGSAVSRHTANGLPSRQRWPEISPFVRTPLRSSRYRSVKPLRWSLILLLMTLSGYEQRMNSNPVPSLLTPNSVGLCCEVQASIR